MQGGMDFGIRIVTVTKKFQSAADKRTGRKKFLSYQRTLRGPSSQASSHKQL